MRVTTRVDEACLFSDCPSLWTQGRRDSRAGTWREVCPFFAASKVPNEKAFDDDGRPVWGREQFVDAHEIPGPTLTLLPYPPIYGQPWLSFTHSGWLHPSDGHLTWQQCILSGQPSKPSVQAHPHAATCLQGPQLRPVCP